MPIPSLVEFGYFPERLDLSSGSISVSSRADLAETVANVEMSSQVENDWIYAPPQLLTTFGGQSRQRPYSSRVFGLPKTHVIKHERSDGEDHLTFHVWALSFFTGMRLTSTEAGFVDATPIKPWKLVDFAFRGSLVKALDLAETFWQCHRSKPECAKLVAATVHALFLAQGRRNLQFERFILSYAAIDACFALARLVKRTTRRTKHADRVKWMCDEFGMPTPAWADPASGAEIASLRNETLHEALFVGEPLGFALHKPGASQNLTLEMYALVCRLVVALLGAKTSDYVRSPVNSRQRHLLHLDAP